MTSAPGPASDDEYSPAPGLIVRRSHPRLRVEARDEGAAAIFSLALTPRDPAPATSLDADSLAARVARHWWYHTIELPGGVVTPGIFDHRPLVAHYGLPDSIQGRTVLDVGTADGFWAFVFERLGGDVTALDVERLSNADFPREAGRKIIVAGADRATGDTFAVAHAALGSKVRRLTRSVYQLDPGELGTFDFVHAGDLLLHLRDPLAALQAIRRVTRGQALIADCIDPKLEGNLTRYVGGWEVVTWWIPSLDVLAQMLIDAGFARVELRSIYSLAETGGTPGRWRASILASVE